MIDRVADLRFAIPILAILAAITWFPVLDEPYAEDDYLFLEAVTRTDAPPIWHYLWSEGVMDHHYRPLSDPLFFTLTNALFGLNPLGYHLLLLLAHVTTAVLVVRLALAVGLGAPGAILAGMIVVSRDSSFPSLVWGSGVSDVGSAMFAVASALAFACWIRSDPGPGSPTTRRATRGIAIVTYVLAVLTKETAVVLLGLYPLVWLWVESRSGVPLAIGRGVVARLKSLLAAIWPFLVVGIPIAIVQATMARFEEGYGQRLYGLSLGLHLLRVWPAYLLWSLAGVRELLDRPVVYVPLAVIAYAGLVVVIGAGLRGARWGRRVLFALAWLTIAVAPALLAPGRILTSYLSIAGVGPALLLGGAIAHLARSRGLRMGAVALALAVVAAGPALVALKDGGHIASGGWINLARSRRMEHVVTELVSRIIPDPPPAARLLVFGALDYDLRVLGDPRGQGFGIQQVLPSAIRVRYARSDLEVLSLPAVTRCPPEVLARVAGVVRQDPGSVRVVVTDRDVRDRTEPARLAALGGGGPAALARALLADPDRLLE